MAAEKRKCETLVKGEECEEDEENLALSSKRRKVEFQDVTVYNFKRRQGYVCVPSQVNLIFFCNFAAFNQQGQIPG